MIPNRLWRNTEFTRTLLVDQISRRTILFISDESTVMTILQKSLFGYLYADKKFKSSPKVIKKLLDLYPSSFRLVPYAARTKDICEYAIAKNIDSAYFVPMHLYPKMTPDASEAVKNIFSNQLANLIYIKNLSLSLYFINKKTYELCKAAVETNGLNLEYVPKDLEQFQEIQNIALNQNQEAIQFVQTITINPAI